MDKMFWIQLQNLKIIPFIFTVSLQLADKYSEYKIGFTGKARNAFYRNSKVD